MPSKSTKSSSKSKLSNAEQSPSPRTPSVLSSSNVLEFSEKDVSLCLEEASIRFPTIIGKSAFIGRVTAVVNDSKGCKIWLSESSMVSSSLSPGSIVSVSLAALGSRFSNPLSSILVECSSQFDAECLDDSDNEVGNYFAFAMVYASAKATKDEVRLSSSLSYTMGCPTAGRIMFIYPIQNQCLKDLLNGEGKPSARRIGGLIIYRCSELHLELVPVKDGEKLNSDVKSLLHCTEKSYGQSENGKISSPRTPLCQPKLSCSSPSLSASSRCKEAASNLSSQTYSDSLDVKEILKNGIVKQLLQSCVPSWLCSRILILGNIVAVPIVSKLCLFHVISADKLLGNSLDQQLTSETSNIVPVQSSESVNHLKGAFSIYQGTKVHLHLPSNSISETPYKNSLPFMQTENDLMKNIVGHEMTPLGGLQKEYAVLKDIIMSTMKNNLSGLGLQSTKGVLLHGPPGTGKTCLARLCACDAGVNLFSVNGPEIISQYHGESEQAIHEVFTKASDSAPAVVFIDELDAIAPARKDGGEELSQRMVATLLNLMDGVCRTDGILIIAATNRPDSIEPALRRPGRLDKEIEIGVPSPKQRADILNAILSQMEHTLSDLQVQHLAVATHGFVGADLAALCNEAALIRLRHYAKSRKLNNNLNSIESSIGSETHREIVVNGSRDVHEDSISSTPTALPASSEDSTSTSEALLMDKGSILKVVFEDFEKARMKVRPSAMREVILEVPKVNWEDVGGQKDIKAQLMEAVEWPQKHQDAFQRIGTRPPTGILMFGPPGCSKTLMARAVASEAGLNFFAVKGPELFSKWVGESEKAVRSLFAKARANSPSIIFFDEIDGLAVIRGKENDGVSVSDRVMTQLLVELDGLHQRVNVTVIAATNRPDKIDSALLRPGRFDRLLYVGPPSLTDREDIFHIHLRKIQCSSNVSVKELARLTEGCTGADISFICREAAIAAIEECIDASEVTMQHLETAIRQVRPSRSESYHELSAKFQRLVLSNRRQDSVENTKTSASSNEFHFGRLIKTATGFLSSLVTPSSKSLASG